MYLLNRVSKSGKKDSRTPYEQGMGKKPDLKHVRAFGEEGFELVTKQFLRKFNAKVKRGILVGYEVESTNFRLYHPDTRKITISRHDLFCEGVNVCKVSSDDSDEEELPLPLRDLNEVPVHDDEQEPPVDNAI